MYYTYIKMRLNKRSLWCVILFAAVIITISCQSPSYAFSLADQAKDYRERGYTAQLSGDLDSALMFYQKAVSLDPSFAMAYNDLGVIFEMRSDTDRAEESYLKAIELDSSYLAAYSNLAYLYEKKGNLLKAALYWQRRIENGLPDDIWTIKAKDNLKRLSAISPVVRDMYLQDEAEQFSLEIAQKKINEFKQRIALAKEHFEKGRDLYDKKDFALAINEFKLARKLTPDDARTDKAIELAKQALIDSKVNEYANNGLKYYQAGDDISARNEFKKLLAIIPASSNRKPK